MHTHDYVHTFKLQNSNKKYSERRMNIAGFSVAFAWLANVFIVIRMQAL